MNLNQLIYANEINRLGSFSRAAQTLYISQSALSKSIRALEEELGEEIFIRTTEGIAPTDFGRAFLAEAERTLVHVERIRALTERRDEREGKTLKFNASCGQMMFASETFVRLVAQNLGKDTDFRFSQRSHSEVFTDVRDGKSDLGVLTTLNSYTEAACRLFEENEIEYHSLGKLNVGVAVDRSNPVNELGLTRLPKGVLADQVFIIPKESLYPFDQEEAELCAAFGNPKKVHVADNDTAASLCRQLPAYFCVAQSSKIYSKLNVPISLLIYPYQNVSLKYEFGWIKKKKVELTGLEKQFIQEIGKLFR